MCLTRNILDVAPTWVDELLYVQRRETTPVAVSVGFFISSYLSCDTEEKLWLNLTGLQTRGPNLFALIQCGPVFTAFTGPCPWDSSQLNFLAPLGPTRISRLPHFPKGHIARLILVGFALSCSFNSGLRLNKILLRATWGFTNHEGAPDVFSLQLAWVKCRTVLVWEPQ